MNYKNEDQKDNIGHDETKNQGQIVPSKNPIAVLKSISDFDEINQEISQAFLCKKVEKLTTALYLITGFLSDNEPLKWSIREGGLAVLSDVTAIGTAVASETSQQIKKIMSDIEKTVSLLEIATTARFMSEMNLTILKEEYLSLVQILGTRKRGGLEESFVFGREFFSTRGASRTISGMKAEREELHKGQTIKDKEIISDTKISTPPQEKDTPVSNSGKVQISDIYKSHDSEKPLGKTIPDSKKSSEKDSRRGMIISIIQEKESLSIKDITTHFSQCGEKTIQRELVALVADNVLKKTGDRRWSKYSMA